MSIGFVPGPGGFPWLFGEAFSGDPSVSPGLARPIGWEVRHPDGTAAWFKTGPLDTDWTAFTDLGGAKTLAELYTNGLADPPLDNLFPMPSGNLRFPGENGSERFPNAAYFESSTTGGDGRVAAWYTRRYYRVASSVGGFEGDDFVGFDPAWSGTFGDLNDFTIVPERTGFTSDPSETGNLAFMELGSQRLEVQGGFFDGPITSPTPGFNSGVRARRDTYLRNGLDGLQRRHTITGWGQMIGYPLSTAAGITAQMYTAADFSNAPATDGNGIGWFIGYGVGDPLPDPPRAIYEAHCMSGAAPTGAWGLGFWAASAAGTINKIATLDWTNGFVLNVPISPASSAIAQTYVTPVMNFMTPNQFAAFNTPVVAGKKLISLVGRLCIVSRDAALTTAPVFAVAQNGVDISGTVSPATATINGQAAPANLASLPAAMPSADMTNFPIQIHQTTAAAGTGLTTCTGFYMLSAVYN
jgi:hypothetical protein